MRKLLIIGLAWIVAALAAGGHPAAYATYQAQLAALPAPYQRTTIGFTARMI